MKGLKLVLSVYGVIFLVVLVAAFVWAVPAFAQSQRDSCQFVEAGIEQFSGQPNTSVEPMTAEMCIAAVDSAGAKLIRGFVGTVASMVVSGFLTLFAMAGLFIVASALTKKSPE